jgi:hypothetical protein
VLEVSSGAECTVRGRRPAMSRSRPRLQATRCGRCWRNFANGEMQRAAAHKLASYDNLLKVRDCYTISLQPYTSRLIVMCPVHRLHHHNTHSTRAGSSELS